MRPRYRLASLAVLAIPAIFISVAVWRGIAPQAPAIDQCKQSDPTCADGPQYGTPIGDGLIFVGGPELQSADVADKSLAVVRFAAKATAADIREFLTVNQISVVDGPKEGGLYTVQLRVTGEAKQNVVKQLQARSEIIEFIATVQ
jgi:hypothetical protein